MNPAIRKLLCDHREHTEGTRQLTRAELVLFQDVSIDRIKDYLCQRFPGEVPIVQGLTPRGVVVFTDSYGSHTMRLDDLGHRIVDNGYGRRYVRD